MISLATRPSPLTELTFPLFSKVVKVSCFSFEGPGVESGVEGDRGGGTDAVGGLLDERLPLPSSFMNHQPTRM